MNDEYRVGTLEGTWAVWRRAGVIWVRVPGSWASEAEAAAYVAYALAAEA